MVDIFMFPAYEGDCILIRYGEPNGIKHNILVDGGVDVNARDIAEIIEFVYSNEERIDIVITHIDGDHIQGLISGLNMVSSEKLQACLSTIYFNNHRDIVKSLKLSGMSDKGAEDSVKTVVYSSNGYSVSEAKSLLEILRDKGVGDKIDGFVTMGRNIEIAGAILNIISPSEKELKKLAIEWESELKKEDKIITGYATENPEQIDIDELMNVRFPRADSSIFNRASIGFLFKYDDTQIAFLGDASAPVLCRGLKRCGINNPIEVDAVKLSHHGSGRNISKNLLSLLKTNVYMLSTNGNALKKKKSLPWKITISKILKDKIEEKVHLLNNYSWWDICYNGKFFTKEDKNNYINTGKLCLYNVYENGYIVKEGLKIYGDWHNR